MSNVARRINAHEALDLADLSEDSVLTKFSESAPVLATPAAAAATAGATLAAGSAVGGFVAEEAADG